MIILTARQWGLVFTAICTAVLATVYISEYFFQMHPCHLCLLQRIPYAVALVLALLAVTTQKEWFLPLLAVAFAASFGFALFHFGVENKWWTYASNCTGNDMFKPGASVEQMMAALKAAPTVRCDQVVPFLFGMSMAFYNTLSSIVFTGMALYASRNVLRG